MKLLSSQKARIIELLKEFEFQFKEFEIVETGPSPAYGIFTTTLTYKEKPSYCFSIRDTKARNDYDYIVSYSPGENSFEDKHAVNSFGESMNYFERWVDYLKREIEADYTIDTWLKELQEEEIKFDEKETDFFKENEKELIRSKIESLKVSIQESKLLQTEQLKLVSSKLDILSEKMDKLNKFDWKTYCLGTFTAILIALSVTAEQGRTLWSMFMEFMSSQLKLK